MAQDQVTYERLGAAAVLTIDRPERRNAVDGPTADLLAEGYERFEADDEARVLILTGRMVAADEALGMGLVTELVPAGRHLERALELAEGLASFPQETMLADRMAAIEGIGLPFEQGLQREAQSGLALHHVAQAGAARFAGGEGRGGAGAGV